MCRRTISCEQRISLCQRCRTRLRLVLTVCSAEMAVLVRIQPTNVTIANVSEKFLHLTGYTRDFLGTQSDVQNRQNMR